MTTEENLSGFDTSCGIHLLPVFELQNEPVKGMSDQDSSGNVFSVSNITRLNSAMIKVSLSALRTKQFLNIVHSLTRYDIWSHTQQNIFVQL